MKGVKKFFVIMIGLCACILCACSNRGYNSPLEVLKNNYASQEYSITFSGENLDTPLDDITYSAVNMPKLPTPKRVGYVFGGWYLDKEYTIPYVDNILYLYMSDVTLYAKWVEESFDTNGTYDISFSAEIVEGTVEKGSLTDDYGGYKDFSQSIVSNETYIEKSDGKLLLKLQYDSEYGIPWGAAYPVYTINISPLMPSSVHIDNKIDALNDTVKTIFIDITDMELSDTLYLYIQTVNWEYEDIDDSERYKTMTSYTVAFNITEIIGFSKIFIDPDNILEEGYYLAKTYYSALDGSENMGASYNPVYSYIYSDGESYKLIKQNIPYAGLVTAMTGNLDPYYLNYFYRMMTFMPIQVFYDIDRSEYDKSNVSDFAPESYKAGYYGNYTIEFHADTGKAYNIFDISTNLRTEYLAVSGVTGYMEVFSAMGTYNQVLSIDYDNIIKIAECDYEPLTGDAYQYESDMHYYPGYLSDLNDFGIAYEAAVSGGFSTSLINYFYSAFSASASYEERRVYDSKITVTPASSAIAQPVSQSRYSIADFTVNTQVYGYDEFTDGTLYADSLTVKSLGGGSSLREEYVVKAGKTLNAGDIVRLADIYAEKVDGDYDFNNVQYKAYRMNQGMIDYAEEVKLQYSTFNFDQDIAVVFTTERDDGVKKTVVELVKYEAPYVEIKNTGDFPYEPDGDHTAGTTVAVPFVSYSWLGKKYFFTDAYYASGDLGVDVVRTAYVTVEDGSETFNYFNRETTTVKLSGDKTIILYELTNIYGERYYYHVDFDISHKITYSITDNSGNEIETDAVKFDNDGERKAITCQPVSETLTAENAIEKMSAEYSIRINKNEGEFILSSFGIETDGSTVIQSVNGMSNSEAAEYIWSLIKDSAYAFVEINYEHGDDILIKTYIYNVTYSSGAEFDLFDYASYFAEYDYAFRKMYLYDKNGELIRGISYWTCKGDSDNLSPIKQQYQYTYNFDKAGSYVFTCNMTAISDTATIIWQQEFEVLPHYSDITVTYVTDAMHPFDDGTLEMTVTYNLAEPIYTLKKSQCANNVKDILYGWTKKRAQSAFTAYQAGNALTSFVNTFNSDSITLYAVWDPGITVTYVAEGMNETHVLYYLQTNSYQGRYVIDLYDYTDKAPAGKYFAGWTGGFLGDEIIKGQYMASSYYYILSNDLDYDNEDLFVIHAVFLDVYTVKYQIDENYSDAFFANEYVLDGKTVSVPIAKSNLSCKIEGYEFKGWYILGDETQTLIDLEIYVVTENVTFVALFGPIGE